MNQDSVVNTEEMNEKKRIRVVPVIIIRFLLSKMLKSEEDVGALVAAMQDVTRCLPGIR